MAYTILQGKIPMQTEVYNNIEQLTDVANNVLEKDNTTAYTPTADYHPSTRKYVDDGLALKLDTTLKGANNGLAELDANGFVPLSQLPSGVKDSKVVADIAARDAIIARDRFEGLRVHVIDASADVTVTSGSAGYILKSGLTNSDWEKTYESESIDVDLSDYFSKTNDDTDDITEGAENLFFTQLRARTAAVADSITDGITDVAPSQNVVFDALALKEDAITPGTIAQYWRGDKTFQTLNKTAVGLGNVDNVQQLPLSYLDTDDTLAADSDTKVASQQAVKAYIDNSISTVNTDIEELTTPLIVTSSVTVGINDREIHFMGGTGVTITLGLPTSVPAGRVFTKKITNFSTTDVPTINLGTSTTTVAAFTADTYIFSTVGGDWI